jgi:hypothetical protein
MWKRLTAPFMRWERVRSNYTIEDGWTYLVVTDWSENKIALVVNLDPSLFPEL